MWTTAPTLVHDVLDNTDHDIALQGISAFDFAEIDSLLAAMPQVDWNFFSGQSVPPVGPADNLQVSSFNSGPEYNDFAFSESDYNFSFDDFSFMGSDSDTLIAHSSPSPTHPVHKEMSTSISSDFTLSPVILPAAPPASTAPPAQLLERQPEGPRRTTRRHVPSTRKEVLNAIGYSPKSRVSLPGDVGKENSLSGMKRKAGAISGANK